MAITAETNRVLGRHGSCLIVGGDVALRKARLLPAVRAVIAIVAPETSRVSAVFARTHTLWLALRKFETADVEGNCVAVSTIGDAVVAALGRHSAGFCAKQST